MGKKVDRLDASIGGQVIVRENEFETVVRCAKCHEELNLRFQAYFDPYRGKVGKYVHFDCLSQKRKDELDAEGVVVV